MRILVIGKHQKINHPVGNGRWLSTQTLYAHSLLCDPQILARAGSLPQVQRVNEALETGDETFVVYPHPTPGDHATNTDQTLHRGGGALINAPSSRFLANAKSLQWLDGADQWFRCLRERWDLGRHSSGFYHFDETNNT